MLELGKISTLAFSRMKQRGITLDTLRDLLANGHVEKRPDGAQLVYLDCNLPRPARNGSPKRTLYAVLDAAGEVLTVEKRVRLGGLNGERKAGEQKRSLCLDNYARVSTKDTLLET